MIKVFDLRQWWALSHTTAQIEYLDHILFEPVEGHSHLFVADVTSEDELVLAFLGCKVDKTIHTEQFVPDGSSRILFKSDGKYFIIEVSHGVLSKNT